MRKTFTKLLAAVLALLLTACGQQGGGTPDTWEGDPFTLTVRVSEAQDTLDPAQNTAQGGETILYHLFENLLRWEDGGDGWAVLAPGQAESWTAETDYTGSTSYTFKLRAGIKWSDGKAVTAEDFVTAWQRLADPANDLPHRELMASIAGYDEVQESGDASLLAVSAPDDKTFTVTLESGASSLLAELCAGAYTMPVRADLAERQGWGADASATVTNGAYTLSRLTPALVTLERSETYYDTAAVGPDCLQFAAGEGAEEDYGSFLNGDVRLISALPSEALEALAAEENWTPDPVTDLYGVLINTRQAPFDNPDVRLAFRLAVDTQAVTDALGNLTARPAAGLVPYGVADYTQLSDGPEAGGAQPDASAPEESEENPAPYWDFRSHSLDQVTMPEEQDYTADCQEARNLLAQAGYAGGSGFPAVEYVYVTSAMGDAVARSLCSMWQEQLGVTVTARALSQEEYDAALSPAQEDGGDDAAAGETEETAAASYQLAGQSFSAGRWDALDLLDLWHSGNNLSGYASEAADIVLDSARSAQSEEARDAFLHDAEATLLEEAPVIPVCFRGSGYLLGENLTGLFRAPDGVFFLTGIKEAGQE